MTQRLFGIGKERLAVVLRMGQVDWVDVSPLEQIHEIFAAPDPAVPEEEREEVILPPSVPIGNPKTKIPLLVTRFCSTRDFGIKECLKYSTRYCPLDFSGWSQRLLLPIWDYRGALVSAVGRSLTSQKPRYLNLPGVSIKKKGVLYGEDRWVPGRMILVEGPLDTWRIGDGAVASFGASLTIAQMQKIWSMGVSELIVAWDADAYQSAIKFGRELSPLLPSVKVVRLPPGEDPDSFGKENLYRLIEQTPPL